MKFAPIEYVDGVLRLLDQRILPHEEEVIECHSLEDAHEAIKAMVVRGAPCIGFTAIYGIALWLKGREAASSSEIDEACEFLCSARPTAVNLKFEVGRVKQMLEKHISISRGRNFLKIYQDIVQFGELQIENSEVQNRKMASFAEDDLKKRLPNKKKFKVLTHCNTGYLACGSIGTALGAIQSLAEKNLIENVWVDETRPYLQGSRLTAYELEKLEIPHNIVVEGSASYLMANGLVDAIYVGADRIVANGDTANKVGTSNLSIIAKYYNIPFYVIAPSSSFDLSLKSGSLIEIEMRDEEEILSYRNIKIAPINSRALNPSFDITEGKLITGIISEKGIASGGDLERIREIVNG